MGVRAIRCAVACLLCLSTLACAAAASATAAEAARWQQRVQHATITRDDWGIAHVHGRTDADAVFGAIYAQAEDDFPRIEANYLTSLGRTAEAEGASALWQDLRMRLFVSPEGLRRDYAASPPWLRTLMVAWADGLNFYLHSHPAVHAKVLTRFEPWMALSFSEGSIGGDIERVSLSQLEAFYSGHAVAQNDMERGRVDPEPRGSNGIAIAPKRTVDGRALLLINPHTSFFFRAELQMTSDEGLNAYGASTWGQFFIYQGFNAHAGWMHTSSGIDNVDEFAETVSEGKGRLTSSLTSSLTYKYGGTQRPVTTSSVRLAYRADDGSMAERRYTTWRTHHGPVVRRAEDGRWIAMALMQRPVQALQQSFLRTKAVDRAGFMKVAALQANSSNNTLFADDRGEIAYLHPQFVPIRDDRHDYTRPVDGSDPSTDWHGLHALSTLPQVLDPASGWVMNTNDAPWGAAGPGDSPRREAFPRYMDLFGENPRGLHATQLLQSRAPFTLESLMQAAYDPGQPAFDVLISALLVACDRAPAERQKALHDQIALLRGWDHRWAADSVANSLAVFWAEALRDVLGPRDPDKRGALPDDMVALTSDTQKVDALATASERLVRDFGDWRTPWGEINRYQRNDGAIAQTFDDARPSTPVPFGSAQWGSLASFGAQRYPGTRRFYGTSGNSFVAVVEFGDPVRAKAVSVGGESGDPASPHFADQIDRYVRGDLRDVYFTPEQLAGHAQRRYRPGE